MTAPSESHTLSAATLHFDKGITDSAMNLILYHLSPEMVGQMTRYIAEKIGDKTGRDSVGLAAFFVAASSLSRLLGDNHHYVDYLDVEMGEIFRASLRYAADADSNKRNFGLLGKKLNTMAIPFNLFAFSSIEKNPDGSSTHHFYGPAALYAYEKHPNCDVLSHSDDEIGQLVIFSAHSLVDFRGWCMEYDHVLKALEPLFKGGYQDQHGQLKFSLSDENLIFMMGGRWRFDVDYRDPGYDETVNYPLVPFHRGPGIV